MTPISSDHPAAPVYESATIRYPFRFAEIILLLIAWGIGISGLVLSSVKLTGEQPEELIMVATISGAALIAIHLVLQWRAPYADTVILPAAVALNGLGLAMIYRLDVGSQVTGGSQDYASRQFQWTIVGIIAAALVLVFLRDHRTLRRYQYIAMVIGIVLILLPLVPKLGHEINGARIWIKIAGNSLQPAEFAKIAFAIFFAGYLVTTRDNISHAGPRILGMQFPRVRDLGPILIIWVIALIVLIFERDLGTSLLFFGLFVAMLYIATEKLSWVFIGFLLIVIGAGAALTTMSHVQGRFDTWLHPFDPEIYHREFGGSGQLVAGLFGLANGGLFGTGWGSGFPRLVPYAYSDFIYTSLGEELGLVGLLAILVLYLVITTRGMKSALQVRDGFGKLLAAGLSFVTIWQVFIVVGGITRVIPLTGLTLPFIAHGGSSLLANWIILAILLRISHAARKPSIAPTRGDIVAGAIRPATDDEPHPAEPLAQLSAQESHRHASRSDVTSSKNLPQSADDTPTVMILNQQHHDEEPNL